MIIIINCVKSLVKMLYYYIVKPTESIFRTVDAKQNELKSVGKFYYITHDTLDEVVYWGYFKKISKQVSIRAIKRNLIF